MWRHSFLFKHLILLTAVSVLPLLLLNFYSLYREYRHAQTETFRTVSGHADQASRIAQAALSQIEYNLRVIQSRREEQAADNRHCASLLKSFVEQNPVYEQLEVRNPSGLLKCASDPSPSTVDTSPAWLTKTVHARGFHMSAPFTMPGPGGSRLHVTRIVYSTINDTTREPEIIALVVNLEALSRTLSVAGLVRESVVSIMDSAGRVVARSPDFQKFAGAVMTDVVAEQKKGRDAFVAQGLDGVSRLYFVHEVGSHGLQAAVGVPAAAVAAPLEEEAARAMALTLAVLGAGLLVTGWHSATLSRSFRTLVRAAGELASGKREVKLNASMPGELGVLANELLQLLDVLRAKNQRLQQSQERALRLSVVNETLSDVVQAVARKREIDRLLKEIGILCVEKLGAMAAWFSWSDADRPPVVHVRQGNEQMLQHNLVQHGSLPGILALVFADQDNGELVVLNDAMDPRGMTQLRTEAVESGARSFASVAIKGEAGQIAGRLNFYADRPDFFDEEVTRFLRAVASELSFALMGYAQDAARVNAEREVADHAQRLAGIIDTAMDAIITINAQQRIVVFNRAAAKMFKVTPEDALGSTVEQFLPLDARARHAAHIAQFASSEEQHVAHWRAFRLRGLRSTGEEFPMDATLVKFGTGKKVLMTVTIRDVSEIEAAEESRKAEARAAAASQAKTEFISQMSHELRTPLNAVLGFSQMLQTSARDRLNPKEQHQLGLIFNAGSQLRTLIDDVLDVSRIEAGRVSVSMQRINLTPLVHDVVLLLEHMAQERGIRFVVPDALNGPVYASTDSTRVRQVLLNLLSNAVKYNKPSGQVTVQVRRVDSHAEIEVTDTGIGMSPQQLEQLFQPFNRLGRESTRIEGTGLGMMLTRKLVDVIGGSMTVESQESVGTKVVVRLPALAADIEPTAQLLAPAALASNPETQAAPEGPPVGRVLYVEDNEVNVMLVEAMLAHWDNVEVQSAATVAEGLEKAERLRPDLVLLDMNLGDGTGLDFMAQVRQRPALQGLCIVALSANAMPEEVEAAKAAGVKDYWTKPLSAAKFQDGVRRLLAKDAPAA